MKRVTDSWLLISLLFVMMFVGYPCCAAATVSSSSIATTSLLTGATSSYEFQFNATNGLPSGSTITVVYPAGFNIAAATKTDYAQSYYLPIQAITGQTITYKVGASAAQSAGSMFYDFYTSTGGIVNPVTPGTYLVQISTSNDPTPVSVPVTINVIYAIPANGNCGTSNNAIFTSVPTNYLCSTGTATAVTGTGPWGWTCSGINGGTTSTCNASIQTYTITANVTGSNGTVSCTSPINNGATSSCTISPASGYQLATFTDNSVDKIGAVAGGGYSIAKVTANHSIEATFRDSQIPYISAFTIPATTTTLNVAVTAFTSTDNAAVTGYLLTETATKPAPSAIGWSATKPTSYTFVGIPDGIATLKTLYAWAEDAAGNVSNSATATTTITLPDVTKPVITAFTIPAFAPLIVPVSTFTATDNVAVSSYCITETNSSTGCNWSATFPRNYTFTTAGNKILYSWAKDSAGNISISLSASVTVDLTGPTLALSTLANGAITNNATLNVAGTVNDNGNGVKSVMVNGQAATITNGTFTIAITLVPGANSITTIATDNINNSTTITRSITLDQTAPILDITLPADNSVTNKAFTDVTGSVDDSTAIVNAKVNGGTATTATMTGTTFSSTLNLLSGLNTIDITATDLAGNISSAKRSVKSDTTAPTLSVTNPAQDASTALSSITINGTVTDAVTSATISISVDSQTYTPTVDATGNFSQIIKMPDAKTYAIVVTATDQAGNTSVVQRNIIRTTSGITTNAKVYLGADDIFTVSNSGATIYGSAGIDTVTIANDIYGITLDQNVNRIIFSGASENYTFKQTGNKINIYDISGITLIVSIPLQGDADGTVISFNNGSASAKIINGIMIIGEATVSATLPTALRIITTASTPVTTTTTKAKVYLSAGDTFTVSNNGVTLYGSGGDDTVTIAAGISDVKLDQNVDRINLFGASSSYTFKQTGNKINVYDASGFILLTSVPVQGDSDGTVIAFSNGYASAKLAAGVMTLGEVTVSTSLPTSLNPTLK